VLHILADLDNLTYDLLAWIDNAVIGNGGRGNI
jgi:hypothetical protein